MNRKLIFMFATIIIILAISFVAIKKSNNTSSNNKGENQSSQGLNVNNKDELNTSSTNKMDANTQEEKNIHDGARVLIAYFSRADENYPVGNVDVGNTEIMAGFIKDYFGEKADTFKIDPVVSYPKNYKECTEVATQELNLNARPEFN